MPASRSRAFESSSSRLKCCSEAKKISVTTSRCRVFRSPRFARARRITASRRSTSSFDGCPEVIVGSCEWIGRAVNARGFAVLLASSSDGLPRALLLLRGSRLRLGLRRALLLRRGLLLRRRLLLRRCALRCRALLVRARALHLRG